MRFTKMHGAGNDYVYVDLFDERVERPEAVAVAVSDRHKGIGSDGLILLAPSRVADVKMVMFNSDGSRSGMCGNGLRCLARLARDRGRVKSDTVRVETDAGVHGWGECYTQADRDRTIATMLEAMRRYLVGRDAGAIKHLTHALYHDFLHKRGLRQGATAWSESESAKPDLERAKLAS